MRGFDAQHGTDFEVSVEGIPQNEWSNVHAQGYLDLAFVPIETIRTVRVIKGPFSVDQGAFALAGSAEYQLGIAPDSLGLRAAYTLGTTNRHRGLLTWSPQEGDGHDFVALEGVHDSGFGAQRGIARASALGKWRVPNLPHGVTLSLLAGAYYGDFELPGTLRNEDVERDERGFYDRYDPAGHGRSTKGFDWSRATTLTRKTSSETAAHAGGSTGTPTTPATTSSGARACSAIHLAPRMRSIGSSGGTWWWRRAHDMTARGPNEASTALGGAQ